MRHLMCLQVTCLNESLVALIAALRLLYSMEHFMCIQVTCLKESLATLIAGKRLLFCVQHFMCPQAKRGRKSRIRETMTLLTDGDNRTILFFLFFIFYLAQRAESVESLVALIAAKTNSLPC